MWTIRTRYQGATIIVVLSFHERWPPYARCCHVLVDSEVPLLPPRDRTSCAATRSMDRRRAPFVPLAEVTPHTPEAAQSRNRKVTLLLRRSPACQGSGCAHVSQVYESSSLQSAPGGASPCHCPEVVLHSPRLRVGALLSGSRAAPLTNPTRDRFYFKGYTVHT